LEPYKLAYRAYTIARAIARAARVNGALRHSLGRLAGRSVFSMSANIDQPISIQGHQMFLAAAGRYPSLDMLMDKYEEATTQLFRQLLQPGMVVVDVGANVGYFSLLSADQVGPTGMVYAFEPEPVNHSLLQKNIDLNAYSNILAMQMAVSNTSGCIEFFLSELDSGSHSIYQEGARGVADKLSVTSTTLDSFLEELGWPNIDLVKIDVEGAELAVLEGMESSIQRSSCLTLILEYCPFLLQSAGLNPSDLLDKLTSLGFQTHIIDDKNGVLPLDEVDSSAITASLLKQKTYMNLACFQI
jgi:FkbM family methyltransferase